MDLDRLQGNWTVVDARLGSRVFEEMIGDTLTIDGDRWIYPGVRRRPPAEVQITLDSTQNPKHLDYPFAPNQGHAIFKIDGDIFTVVQGRWPRPTSFEVSEGTDALLLVFHRQNAPPDPIHENR